MVDNCFSKWSSKQDCLICKCRHSCKRNTPKTYRFCITCVMPRFFKNNRCVECGQPYRVVGRGRPKSRNTSNNA